MASHLFLWHNLAGDLGPHLHTTQNDLFYIFAQCSSQMFNCKTFAFDICIYFYGAYPRWGHGTHLQITWESNTKLDQGHLGMLDPIEVKLHTLQGAKGTKVDKC